MCSMDRSSFVLTASSHRSVFHVLYNFLTQMQLCCPDLFSRALPVPCKFLNFALILFFKQHTCTCSCQEGSCCEIQFGMSTSYELVRNLLLKLKTFPLVIDQVPAKDFANASCTRQTLRVQIAFYIAYIKPEHIGFSSPTA